MDFIGKECIACKKKFVEDDDIVVCETCGTPYHRDCYTQLGKCINNEYHEKGWTFYEKNKPIEILNSSKVDIKSVDNQEVINDVLEDNYNQMIEISNDILNRVELNPNEEHSGVTLLEFYLYTKSLFSTKKFYKSYSENNKNVFSFLALIFPEYYMISKNMYVPAIFIFLIDFFLSIPYVMLYYPQDNDLFYNLISTSEFKILSNVFLILFVLFRVFISNKCLPMYFKECVKNIRSLKQQFKDKSNYDFYKHLIDTKSGIGFFNILVIVLLLICNNILYSYFYFLLNLFLTYFY